MSLEQPPPTAYRLPPTVLLLAALAGCSGPRPAPGAPRKPPFLAYEVSGREVLADAPERRIDRRLFVCATALRSEDRLTGAATIWRLDRKLRWDLDPESRTYAQTTFAEAAAHFQAYRRGLLAALADAELSSAARRSLEIVAGRRTPAVEVQTDPETAPLLGRPCRHTRYLEDGQLRFEAWAAEDLAAPCDLTDVLAIVGDFSPELLRRLKEPRGLRLRTRVIARLPDLPRLTETEVTKLELPARLDPALFEVPAGYRPARPARSPRD